MSLITYATITIWSQVISHQLQVISYFAIGNVISFLLQFLIFTQGTRL